MVAILSSVHLAGGTPLAMAAFSAGRPKASHPMGCSTFFPFMRMKRDSTSPMV
jgi:hypothetical protein